MSERLIRLAFRFPPDYPFRDWPAIYGARMVFIVGWPVLFGLWLYERRRQA